MSRRPLDARWSVAAWVVASACAGGGPDDAPPDPPATGVPVALSHTPAAACEASGWTREAVPRLADDADMPRDLLGGAFAVADLDQDGLRELVFLGLDTARAFTAVPRSGGQAPSLVAADAWLTGLPLSRLTAVVVWDGDGDGDDDLLFVRWREPLVYARNDGAPPLVDASAAVGIDGVSGPFLGAAVGDPDGDGDLDLYLPGYGDKPPTFATPVETTAAGEPGALLLRGPEGAYVDATAWLPAAAQEAYNFGGLFFDQDRDGFDDLFTIHDFGWTRPNQLLRGGADGLTPDPAPGFGIPFAGMGVDLADVNEDGEADLAQSSWLEVSLLVPDAGVYYEEATLRGLTPDGLAPRQQFFGWGTALSDLDGDGLLDLAMGFGHWDEWGGLEAQRDALWVQQADGSYLDEADVLGLDDPGATRGLMVTDLTGDGRAAMVTRRQREGGRIDVGPCPAGGRLHVELRQGGLNAAAVGAEVTLRTRDRQRRAWVLAGSHHLFASGPPEVAFTWAPGEVPEGTARVVVRWPDGQESVVPDAPASGRLRIMRR